ncbi:glycosyltransferase [Patescibacteria group bacterium]|nr:glycosyltransferase [Patescibacteria group bacterium]
MKIENLKIALFYDWLNQWGGAERLLLDIIKIFPNAPLFTSVHNPNQTNWLPKNTKIISSHLNKFKIFLKNSPISLLLQPVALEQFDFSNFDIVISLSGMQGKCLLTQPKTLHVNYCLTPNRYLYQKNLPLKNFYKKIDFIYSQRPDHYLTTSKTVQKRITKHFNRNSTIIYPGVNLSLFKPSNSPTRTYFLIVSRLVKHKKIDIAIKTCQKLNIPLIIVGAGRHQNYFKKLSHQFNTTRFLASVSDKKLIHLYQNASALICPQFEDFGLTPLEAQACGIPVIALNKGGFKETIIPYKTGILFNHQNTSSLITAIKKFQQTRFNPKNCAKNAKKFSQHLFMLNFKKVIEQLWQKHKKKHNATITT